VTEKLDKVKETLKVLKRGLSDASNLLNAVEKTIDGLELKLLELKTELERDE